MTTKNEKPTHYAVYFKTPRAHYANGPLSDHSLVKISEDCRSKKAAKNFLAVTRGIFAADIDRVVAVVSGTYPGAPFHSVENE